ncbi:alpha/beta fold hydrolase [Chloroflexi bacterium TSY]|nr:alpha/beta fold hydrolase [Chloroflexi bacterium TSY]
MTISTQSANPWFRISYSNPSARLRLFCFPYAGGTASVYRTWHQHLPTDVEVCAVQLPGRENRIRERPLTDVDELVQALIPNLLPYLDKPFVFFGHSMGAIIAHELAQQLYDHSGQTPVYLFVSGRRAPFLPETTTPLHILPTDDALLAEAQKRYNNILAVMFEDAELRQLLVPLLRADFTLVETYQYSEKRRLPFSLIALGGEDDDRASKSQLMAWEELTQANFALHLFPGGHFYLNDQTRPLVTTIASYLRKVK